MDIRNLLDNRINNLIHKINVLLLSLIVSFAPSYVFASLMDPTDQWITESMTENKDSLGRTTTAHLNGRKVQIVNGSFREINAAIDYKPPSGAAARVMSKRLAQAAVGGGLALIGTAAVDALLRGIGWIMKDGVYVKRLAPSDNSLCDIAGGADLTKYLADNGYTGRQCGEFKPHGEQLCTQLFGIKNGSSVGLGSYCVPKPTTEPTDIPITNQELEDIMYGNYSGDADAGISPNDTGDWTGVLESMTPDPNAGEGTKDKPSNEISKDIENKFDAAPNKTTKNTGTESKSNGENTKKNADGTEEKTQTETTQKMPALCQYAAAFCVWMDWTQKDDSDSEEQEIEKEDLDIPTIPNTTKVNFGSNCPAPLHGSYTMLGRTFSIDYPWDAACDVATKFKPAVVGCSGLAAIYIVLGINRKTED